MFQVVQPMQTVTVDGQEALFIPNMGAQANQLNGAQPIQIGNQQAFLTPNGQIIRPGMMPANILQNMGQTVSLPTGKFLCTVASVPWLLFILWKLCLVSARQIVNLISVYILIFI